MASSFIFSYKDNLTVCSRGTPCPCTLAYRTGDKGFMGTFGTKSKYLLGAWTIFSEPGINVGIVLPDYCW